MTQEQIAVLLRDCLEKNKNSEKCPEFIDYNYNDFKDKASSVISNFAKKVHLVDTDLLSESFFYYLSVRLETKVFTGLVFVGYGEGEIYPSLYPIIISQIYDGHLHYYIDHSKVAKIGDETGECSTAICPFAQTDVTLTIINGINPSFQAIIYKVINLTIQSMKDAFGTVIDNLPNGKIISNAFKNIDMKPIIDKATFEINKEMRDS